MDQSCGEEELLVPAATAAAAMASAWLDAPVENWGALLAVAGMGFEGPTTSPALPVGGRGAWEHAWGEGTAGRTEADEGKVGLDEGNQEVVHGDGEEDESTQEEGREHGGTVGEDPG